MSKFNVTQLVQSSILYLYSTRHGIQLNPEYQRVGDVWNLEKRQLLIDSIMNSFDIPKIYFHELPGQMPNKKFKYAIIDGRQRLESIWAFINGEYPFGDDFEYLNDSTVKLAGCTYKELGERYPELKSLFDGTSLSVIVVQTPDRDLIEEMFSRLNEAVPLNAAEKRNALGGPLPKVFREVAALPFFKARINISNKRYQHLDLSAKFIYLVHQNKVADTKKVYLDSFVKSFKGRSFATVKPLRIEVQKVLAAMDKVFVKQDKLLKSAGMIVLYFLLFREAIKKNWLDKLSRSKLDKFEKARLANRVTAEKDITKARYELLEFDRLTQTPNDAYAIEHRLTTLRNFVKAV